MGTPPSPRESDPLSRLKQTSAENHFSALGFVVISSGPGGLFAGSLGSTRDSPLEFPLESPWNLPGSFLGALQESTWESPREFPWGFPRGLLGGLFTTSSRGTCDVSVSGTLTDNELRVSHNKIFELAPRRSRNSKIFWAFLG